MLTYSLTVLAARPLTVIPAIPLCHSERSRGI